MYPTTRTSTRAVTWNSTTTDSVLLGIGKLPLRGYPPPPPAIIEEGGGSEEVEHDY